MCDSFKMCWIAAPGISAAMINLQSFSDRAYELFVSEAMRIDHPTGKPQLAVPEVVMCASPFPADIAASDARIEQIEQPRLAPV
jgi:hypothetical protein